MDQEALADGHGEHDALIHGLWKRVVDGGAINHGAWLRCCAEKSFVGTCRMCGDYLVPLHPYEVQAGRYDYEYNCRNVRCGQTYNAPGGRSFIRSSRRSERTGGTKRGT